MRVTAKAVMPSTVASLRLVPTYSNYSFNIKHA